MYAKIKNEKMVNAKKMKEITGNDAIVARELFQNSRNGVTSNGVTNKTVFRSMNCGSDEITVEEATKICVDNNKYAIVGYHCGEIVAVKIGEEIVHGHVNLYMVSNKCRYGKNNFYVEVIGIIKVNKKYNKIDEYFENHYEITNTESDIVDTHFSYVFFCKNVNCDMSLHDFRQAEARWLRDKGIVNKINVFGRSCYVGVKII